MAEHATNRLRHRRATTSGLLAGGGRGNAVGLLWRGSRHGSPSHSRGAYNVRGGATRRLLGQTRGPEKVNGIGDAEYRSQGNLVSFTDLVQVFPCVRDFARGEWYIQQRKRPRVCSARDRVERR